MSSQLYLETEPSVDCGIDFREADGYCLRDLITFEWGEIVESYVPMDLSFLKYRAFDLEDEDELIENYGEEDAVEVAETHQGRCELAWTSPAEALRMLDAVIAVFSDAGGETRGALIAALQASDCRYALRFGDPVQDLIDVRAAVVCAADAGAQRVRLMEF